MVVRHNLDQSDKFTGYPVGINGDHAYIHKGLAFSLSGTTGSLAAAATYSISFTTPASGKYVHWRPSGISSTANTLQVRVAEASIMTGGSAAVPFNRNRNSKNTSIATISIGATLSTEGSIFFYGQVGAGTNAANASGGGNNGSAEEWVLKPATTYSIRFENIGATTATVGYYNLFWYEEGSGV